DAGSTWVFSTAARIADTGRGETVSNSAGTLALFFPPNSLQGGNGEVAIRVADISGASLTGGKAIAQDGSVTLVGQAYEIDVGEAILRKPVSLTLSYTETDLGGRNPTRLGVFTVEGSVIRRVGGTADPSTRSVRTTVEELGIFALFEDLSIGLGSAAIQDVDCQPRAFAPMGGTLSSETDISFDLTAPADVTVRVYNASGRLERVIARDTPMAPGRNSLAWDGRDEDEDIVSSGLYIVVVSAGDKRAEKVVAVVR
ncbi:MAG: FlgD immunoglobulin-like domain containing protein, partial [Myxococcota bacterium]|nr:FlgD immunoglobulin-like domain containing protein [Myxococcota bacterium]